MKLKRASLGSEAEEKNIVQRQSPEPKRPQEVAIKSDIDNHLNRVGEKLRQLDYLSSATILHLASKFKNAKKKFGNFEEISTLMGNRVKKTSKLFSLYQSRQFKKEKNSHNISDESTVLNQNASTLGDFNSN